MSRTFVSAVLAVLVLSLGIGNAESNDYMKKLPKIPGKDGGHAALGSSQVPAVVAYFDAGLTDRTVCAPSGDTVYVYLVAEGFEPLITSIMYSIHLDGGMALVEEVTIAGTPTGTAFTGIEIGFGGGVDASDQLLLQRLRFAITDSCLTGCDGQNRQIYISDHPGVGEIQAVDTGGQDIIAIGMSAFACASALPDLQIQSFSAPSSAMRYEDIGSSVSLTVHNGGPGNRDSDFFLRYYISEDTVFTASDFIVSMETITGLASGASVSVPLTPARIPLDAPIGDLYFGAFVDHSNMVAELVESNNIAYLPMTISPDPSIDTTCVYAEDFQDGEGGWTAHDYSTGEGTLGIYWHQTMYDIGDGNGERGVMWCGDDNPNWITPPGYGNDWTQRLSKSFTLSGGDSILAFEMQYDTEMGYDAVMVQITDDGSTYITLASYTGVSAGYDTFELDISDYDGEDVTIRFFFYSDGSFSDADGNYDSDGGARIDWVELSGHARDNFDSDSDGWAADGGEQLEPVGGEFRLVYEPLCDSSVPCGYNVGTLEPTVICNAWASYDPVIEQFPFSSPEDRILNRGVHIGIESPDIPLPDDAIAYLLEFDVFAALPVDEWVFWYWEVAAPVGSVWDSDEYVRYGDTGWSTWSIDITEYVKAGATSIKLRLAGQEILSYGASNVHGPSPTYDNVKIFAVQTAATGVDLSGFPRNCAVSDEDWDGVGDLTDSCPSDNSSLFDRDGDGCTDEATGARHIEYLPQNTLEYYIHETGLPGVSDGSDFAAIQAGFDAWAAVPGIDIAVQYLGTTTQEDAQALDGINTVTFSDPDFVFPAGVLAVGITTSFVEPDWFDYRHTRPGLVVDCDIIFNPLVQYRTDTSGSGTDLQSVAVHEAGHLFGISHSPVQTSTMFYVLPPDTTARSLETEDRLAMRKAYPTSQVLGDASRLKGTVMDGKTSDPVCGAIVCAIDAASGDTLAGDYTLIDGSFDFLDLPDGDYYVSIYPLNGSSVISYLQPGNINQMILDNALTVFVPEYYDAAESSADDETAKAPVSVSAGNTTNIAIITNIDEEGPVVTETTPLPGETGVKIDASVLVSFSEPIDIQSISGNFGLYDTANASWLRGNVALIEDDSTLAFITTENLSFETVYRLHLGSGLSDKFGNGLEIPFEMLFTTEVKPDVGIEALAPRKGVVGAIAVISGFGFEESAAGNLVDFNGAEAEILESSSTRLVITVPEGAVTGNVTVENLVEGKTSNALTFTVLPGEEVARGYGAGVSGLGMSPREIAVLPGGSVALVAAAEGLAAIKVDPGAADYLSNETFAIEGGLDGIDVTPNGKNAYAVSGENEKLYRINTELGAGGLGDIAVLNEMDIGAEPSGVIIEPAGKKAYVTTADDVVQVWDINSQSATFDQQVGVIDLEAPSLRGRMATDPAGSRLLVLSGSGHLYVYDLAADTLQAKIGAGFDPRDVAVDPMGERAYVTDGDGYVVVVSLDLLQKVVDISTGGSLRGVAVSPAGSFLYTVNRELNFYDLIDLRSHAETYRSIVANISLPVNPVDVELSPDGLYAYALTEGDRSLVVTAVGVGPALHALTPIAGPEGTELVLTGASFAVDSVIAVSFAGFEVEPSVRRESMVAVTVPSNVGSGPVSLIGRNPFRPDAVSNEVYFQVLGPTGDFTMRQAATIGLGGLELTGSAVSPTGEFTALVTNGGSEYRLHILDTNPGSGSFHQVQGELVLPGGFELDEVVITPDGSRALLVDIGAGGSGEPGYIPVIDINPLSTGFLAVLDSIDVSALTRGLSAVSIGPGGATCLLAEFGSESGPVDAVIHVADIGLAASASCEIITSVAVAPGEIDVMAFHPAGGYCYLPVEHSTNSAVHVLDTDSGSPGYLTIVHSLPLPGTAPMPVPERAAFTPGGLRFLCLRNPYAGDPGIVMLDTFDPSLPHVSHDGSFGELAGGSAGLDISPRGDCAYIATGSGKVVDVVILIEPDTLVVRSELAVPSESFSALGCVPDASRIYATGAGDVYVMDFSGAQSIVKVSGDAQSGIVNTELPAPLRVRVNDAGSQGVAGVPVTFTVTLGGGMLTGSNSGTYIVPTDSTGMASTGWMLGSAIGPQIVQAASSGLDGSPLEYTAAGLVDPETLPIQLVDIIPVDSTTGVSTSTAVRVTFSRPVDLATVDSTTFFIREEGVNTPLPSVIGYSDGNRRLSLTPRSTLTYTRTYEVEVTGGILDESGGPLENPQVSIFTVSDPPPLALSAVSPPSGLRGVPVVVSGLGFDPDLYDNIVHFNGTDGGVTEATDDHLDVVVPFDAVGGNSILQVQIGGQMSNTLMFNVLTQDSIALDQDVIAKVGTGSATRSVVVTPDGARLYAVSPQANTVIAIDIPTLQVIASVPVGENPYAIVIHPMGTYAYVTNFLDHTVSIIDIMPGSLGFNEVSETVPVGLNPLDVLVTPDGDRLIVSNAGSLDLSIVDTDEFSETFHMVLSTVSTGKTTRSVAVTPDGGLLYVGTEDGYLVVDVVDYGVIRSVGTGKTTRSVAVTPDGALLVLLTTEGEVLIIDVAPGSATMDQVVGRVSAGGAARSVSVTPDGGLLYVIMEEEDAILVVKLDVVESAGVLGDPQEAGRTLVNTTIIDSLYTGEDPAEISFAPNGSGVAVITNAGDNTVSVFDPSGGVVSVALSNFLIQQVDTGAMLNWTTHIEEGILGFNLLRSKEEDRGYEQVSDETIKANGRPGAYAYVDKTVKPNNTYYYMLEEVNTKGAGQRFGPLQFVYIARFGMRQNFPNPFNPVTKIQFTLPQKSHVQLVIYDVAGRRVRTLVDKPLQADHYEITWDGRNNHGNMVSSGVYFYRLVAGKHRATKKMVLLR